MNEPFMDWGTLPEKGSAARQQATRDQLLHRIEELERERDEYRRRAEENASRSQYLESALQQAPDALVTLDASHKVVDWNLGAQRMFGYSKNEALDEDLDELIGGPDPGGYTENKKHKLLSRHTMKAVEALRYRKDNTPVRVLVSSAPIALEGTLRGVVAIYTDIGERKRDEEALRERVRGFRDLVNKAPVGMYQTDTERTPYFFSPEMARMLGAASPKEAMRLFRDFASDLYADGTRRKELIRILRRDGEVRNFEFRAWHASGKRIWLSLNARIRKWLSSGTFLVDGFATDISLRKHLEEAQLRKHHKQALLLDSTSTQLWYHTDVNTYGAGNRAHADFLGRSGEELENSSVEELFSPEDATICKKDNIEVFETGEQIHTEKWVRNARGESRFLALTKTPGHDARNNVDCVICSATDITERKQLEEKLKETSFYDPSTGLYNRAFFEEEMRRLEQDHSCPVGILVCHLEASDPAPETSARGKSKEELSSAAAILQRCFRRSTILARIGPDVFAVLLPGVNREILQKYHHRIEQEAKTTHHREGRAAFSLWTGSAVQYDPPVDMPELLRRAEHCARKRNPKRKSSLSRGKTDPKLIQTQMARDYLAKLQGEPGRILDYTLSLGNALGLSEARLDNLRLLARFHDLGKVGIPDRILFKSRRLSQEEFKIMKRHCEIGHHIALSSSSLAPIADFILKHHEWWDGRGYPLGLQGKTIPLECRILALVEAYVAMTADRPYRGAMSRDAAIRELRRYAGTQFDPGLVEPFIGISAKLAPE